MRILVTGAAGYIGTVLVGRLLQDGHRVTALDNLERGGEGLRQYCSDLNFDFVRADARTLKFEDQVKYDCLIPLAGIVGQKACDRRFIDAHLVNCSVVSQMAKWKSKQQLLIYPMTNSGYGTKTSTAICTEDTPLEPISHYGQTKKAAEDEVLQHENVASLRLATVFGMSPNMRWDLLVNNFVQRAVKDRCIVVFQGHYRRNFVHVRDVTDCMAWVIQEYGMLGHKVYNLGNDALNMTKQRLAHEIMIQLPGTYTHLVEVGSDPDKRDYNVSSARLAEAGFLAKRGLVEGIKELVKGVALE